VNALSGKLASWIHNSSNRVFKKENFLTAEKKYIGDWKEMAKDFGARAPKSKTNLLMETFMSNAGGFDGMSGNLMKDTAFKKLFSKSTLHGLSGNSSAEHMIAGTLMYGLMADIIVVNSKGEHLPFDEAFEVKDGKLEVIPGMKLLSNGKEIGNDEKRGVASKLQFVARKTQGNYDSTNRTMAQRHWAGTLAFHMRKWMLPGYEKRYQGLAHSLTDVKDLELHQRYFSEGGQTFNEGNVVTTIRFAKNLYKKAKADQNFLIAASASWNQLTDAERANVEQTVKELLVRALAISAAIFLANLAVDEDDEEDKERLYHSAYILRRIYGEYAIYYEGSINGEGLAMMQTPATVISTAEKCTDAIGQLRHPFQEYMSGDHKGENKFLRKVRKAVFTVPENFNPDYQQKYNYMQKN
jgi:hypothetical protein